MAYTVLARRYRSANFDQVIGQDHVAQTLKKAIRTGRIAHAFLFCGTRGVGKTSMARILAKALNCQSTPGPIDTPCGKCDSCQAIARGEDIDVIEIDAASNTGVDNVRDVISNAAYRPVRGRFKIFIIDEVHMLSKAAFNALLKTLEEPPEHVKFILATTEPEKLPATILSRCQRYDFRNISAREVAGHLKDICKHEKIAADDDALLLVAKAGCGSMRDSLSLLDRLLSIGEKHVDVALVEQLLGLPKAQVLFDLAEAIAAGDVPQTLGRADSIVQGGMSVDSLLAALVDHLHNLLILRTCGSNSELVEVPGLAKAEMDAQAKKFDPAVLVQDVSILEELRRTVRQSQAGRALLDATLVRLALADQFASVGQLLANLDADESPASAAPALKKNSAEMTPPSSVADLSDPGIPASSTPATDSDDDGDDDELPRPGKVFAGPKLSELRDAFAAPPAPAPVTVAANVEPVDPSNLSAVHQALLGALVQPGVKTLIGQARLVSIEDNVAVFSFSAAHDIQMKMLERNGKKEIVRDALSRLLSRDVGVKIEIESAEGAAAPPVMAPAGKTGSRPPAPVDSPEPVAPPTNKRPTPEQVAALRQESPLISSIMDELGGDVQRIDV
ncbi:MAG TPA: DNA polymerase III subunit gamma/tau [Tepidisphaeraceae bacterium]|jgi:DNA polymerase-3 subunit gamma/tau|nr:DNA polymerase III subunit gamma/tau [Tepidisphaeraceae bacterium]